MGLLGDLMQVGGLGMDVYNAFKEQEYTDYMKSQQGIQREREDNAVQRRVADLRAAGLNPVLAAGSAASSSPPINVGTPQISGDNVMKAMSYESMRKQQALTDAQRDLVNAQSEKVGAESWFSKMLSGFAGRTLGPSGSEEHDKFFGDMLENMRSSFLQNYTDAHSAAYNAAIAAGKGVPNTPGSLDAVGQGQILQNALSDPASAATPLANIIKILAQVFK